MIIICQLLCCINLLRCVNLILVILQFTVIARDQSSPEKTGTATVRVNVLRSNNPPVWINNAPYVTAINADTAVGTTVYSQSRAIDNDQLVSIVYIRALDKSSYLMIIREIFLLILHKNICCTSHLNYLKENVQMRGYNICFRREIRKFIIKYSFLPRTLVYFV